MRGGAKRNSPSLSVICLVGHLPISLNDLQPCSSMLVMLLIFTFFSLNVVLTVRSSVLRPGREGGTSTPRLRGTASLCRQPATR